MSFFEQGAEEEAEELDERAKEFLECLGNGKTIYECEFDDFLEEGELF